MSAAYSYPSWFDALVDGAVSRAPAPARSHGVALSYVDGLLRDENCVDADQAQTRSTFAFKWRRQDSYGSPAMLAMSKEWLDRRYAALWRHPAWLEARERPLVIDAGAGAAYSAQLLFKDRFDKIRYVAADISRAIDVAAQAFADQGLEAGCVQADLMRLPFADGAFDIGFSEGVLHHTPSTRDALEAFARKVRPGGAVAFYVYRLKSPIREFSDDFIRDKVSTLDPDEAWRLLEPLTRLGKALGELDAEIDVPEPIELIGVPAGRINVQRLFYWHVVKLFYRPDLSIEEMNHINFDWFTPRYAHRQSEEQVRGWCDELGLRIDDMTVEDAGMTVIATRL
jgi:SAM-dependent methyltransferase